MMKRISRLFCVAGGVSLALAPLAAIPAAHAAPDQPIAAFGGGGGGGGGSKGQLPDQPASAGGGGGSSGQIDATSTPDESGFDGTAGTAYIDVQGIDGSGGAGARGLHKVGAATYVDNPGQPAGVGHGGGSGGNGGAGQYEYVSTTEPATSPSVAIVAGNGGNGANASINSGGPGGQGGNASARFWRSDANGNYTPKAVDVSGEVLVRSGVRGAPGAASSHYDGRPNEPGGAAGLPGDATLAVRGSLSADRINIVKRDGSVDVEATKLLVEEDQTTTLILDGTSPGDVVFEDIEVEPGGTLIIDDSRGGLTVTDEVTVGEGGSIIIIDPGNIAGGGVPTLTVHAQTSLPTTIHLPSAGGSFSVPLTGSGLADVQVRAILDGRAVDIAGSGAATRSEASAELPVAFPANPGSTSRSYGLVVGTGNGLWQPLDVVVEVAGKTAGGSTTIAFTVAPLPRVSGTPQVGYTLTADPGVWIPTATLAFQWFRSDTEIPGATSASYSLVDADADAWLKVRVTGSGEEMSTAYRTSSPALLIAARPPTGGTDDPDGPGGGGGDDGGNGGNNGNNGNNGGNGGDGNNGGNGGNGDNGLGANPGPSDTTVTPPGGVDWVMTQLVTPGGVYQLFLGVVGTARVGRTLSARVVIPPGPQVTYAFQWLRAGKEISGATKSNYVTVSADRTKKVSVRLTATPVGAAPAVLATAGQVIKIGVIKSSRPKISGTTKVGRTLKGTATKWTKGVKKKYQWYRGSKKIAKATKARYKLKAADAGKRITVKVTGTKAGFKKVTRASSAKVIRR